MAFVTSTSDLAVRIHFLMQHCFFKPGPPFLGLSRQNLHWLQSLLIHSGHSPHRFCLLRPSSHVENLCTRKADMLAHVKMFVPFVFVVVVCVSADFCNCFGHWGCKTGAFACLTTCFFASRSSSEMVICLNCLLQWNFVPSWACLLCLLHGF